MTTINFEQPGWENRLFECTANQFEETALSLFQYQYHHNPIYRSYCEALHCHPEQVKILSAIPFLPIQFFKSRPILTGNFAPEAIFESSGTTGTINSKHYVKDLALYQSSFLKGFEHFYGAPQQYCIIGLLPSYLERNNASLVYMTQHLITASGQARSGFYMNEYDKLHHILETNEKEGITTLLIGVTFALLDFFEQYPMQLQHTIVMETGGMKGRRTEMTKAALQQKLGEQSGLKMIHSEYGMTELLSQGYSKGNGIFNSVPWMKIMLRATDNPLENMLTDFSIQKTYRGAVNVIDLANVHSCAFIATEDMGLLHENGSFEILGRMDNSDVRGCSQMVV